LRALITGASSGIGYELAKLFARDGHDLVLVARNRPVLEALADKLKEQHGTSVKVLAKDLGQPSAPQEIVSQLKKDGIQVDVLVNNAGVGAHGPFAESDLKVQLNMIQVNLTALTELTRLFLEDMVKRGQGRIFNIASTAAFQPGPLMAVYYASKAYVLSFSEALAEELRPTGVTITTLCPGPTDTGFQKAAGIQGIRLLKAKRMDAQTVARIGYEGLFKGKVIVISGLTNKIGAFLVRFVPRGIVRRAVRKLQEKNKQLLSWALFLLVLAGAGSEVRGATEPPQTEPRLLEQARAADPERYRFALDRGAQILPTPDGRSFYVFWAPAHWKASQRHPILVTLHGHASWAFDELYLWYPAAAKRGFAILALQWWFGQGESSWSYYLPQEMYPVMETILRGYGVLAGTALLHGFSRGSANVYALTALDQGSGNRFFKLTIANAGGAAPDFPFNVAISNGSYGQGAFAGTHWVLFCSEQDENPKRDGCPAMRNTRQWLESFGGQVDLFLEEFKQGHGGFHQNPRNVNLALDAFDHLTTAQKENGRSRRRSGSSFRQESKW